MPTIEDIADELFGPIQGEARDGLEGLYICPSCGKPKLSVNLETGGYRCWTQPDCSDQKGNIRYRYKGEIAKGGKRLERYRKTESAGDRVILSLEDIDAVPVQHDTSVHAYLTGRGLDDEQIAYYDLRMSWRYKYQDQVIIPVYDNGYKGLQRRFLTPTANGQRYINGKGIRRKELLYNYDRAIDHGELYIAEGIFSAYACGREGIATFGKEVTPLQARRLAATGKPLVVCMDGGEYLAEIKLIMMLLAYGAVQVDRIKLPEGEDPDDTPDFREVERQTRETCSPLWVMRQKAWIVQQAALGLLRVPKGFWKSIQRIC